MKAFFEKIFSFFANLFKSQKKFGGTKTSNEVSKIEMRSLQKALELIKEFEGLRLKAYKDPVGIPTIGWGTIAYPDGRKVQLGDSITAAQADSYLLDHINKQILPHMDRLIQVPITEGQYNALVSFTYNLGAGNLSKSTLLRKLNAGRPAFELADEFKKWVKAGGKTLYGLVRRREAERRVFLS